jgi:hypothetical protein
MFGLQLKFNFIIKNIKLIFFYNIKRDFYRFTKPNLNYKPFFYSFEKKLNIFI